MDFESFEGVKRIENKENLSSDDIFDILKIYEDNIGEIRQEIGLDGSNIIIDTNGAYHIYITVGNQIMIERKDDRDLLLQNENKNEYITSDELAKNANTNPNAINVTTLDDDVITDEEKLEITKVDRIIEQVYDLIRDFMADGEISEHITKAVEKYTMKQEKAKVDKSGLFKSNNDLLFYNESNELVYEARRNSLTNKYTLKNINVKNKNQYSELYVIDFINAFNKENAFSTNILEKESNGLFPFALRTSSVKTVIIGESKGNIIKISADYTDNYYLIEYDEIVIGTVDCLDPEIDKLYNIGVNDLRYRELVLAISVLIDVYKEACTNKLIRNERMEKIRNFFKSKKQFNTKINGTDYKPQKVTTDYKPTKIETKREDLKYKNANNNRPVSAPIEENDTENNE